MRLDQAIGSGETCHKCGWYLLGHQKKILLLLIVFCLLAFIFVDKFIYSDATTAAFSPCSEHSFSRLPVEIPVAFWGPPSLQCQTGTAKAPSLVD